MSSAFVDTSYLLALANSDDEFHDAARKLQQEFRGRLLTTEYVLLELLDALCVGELRAVGTALLDSLRADADVTVVTACPSLFEAGIELFRGRTDKEWGITDCISFAVMRERGITEALTADHHFEQAGFRALLRS